MACSPAFAFTRSAVELDFAELVLLGYEITGSYRLDSNSEQGFFSAPPLVSHSALVSVSSQGNLLGANKAENALRFVSSGSASPMETALAMLLSMPKAKGGYGLPSPQLNAAVEVPKGVGGLHTDGSSSAICYGRQRVFASSTIATCFTLVRRRSRTMRDGEMPFRPLASRLSRLQRAR